MTTSTSMTERPQRRERVGKHFDPWGSLRGIGSPFHVGRHRATQHRPLRYIYWDNGQPTDNVNRLAWMIESQLATLFASHDVDTAFDLLAEFNPALHRDRIVELLDLNDAVHDADINGTREAHFAAIDDYAGALRQLAVSVRAGAR